MSDTLDRVAPQEPSQDDAERWHQKLIPPQATEHQEPSVSSKTPSEMKQWEGQLARAQEYANVMAHLLIIANIVVMAVWVDVFGGLVGLAAASTETGHVLFFHWHPLLMTLAFCFMTSATLAFRYPCTSTMRRSTRKLMHVVGTSVALIFGTSGIVAIIELKRGLEFYSLHSWLGFTTILFYLGQFFVGFFSFAVPLGGIRPNTKAKIVQIHKFVGPLIYMLTTGTVLTGIQEEERILDCLSFFDYGCSLTNIWGALIAAMAAMTVFANHEF